MIQRLPRLPIRPRIPALLFSAVLTIAGGQGLSQPIAAPSQANGPDTRWYQVEVIIFGNNSDPSISPELWRHDIKLSYPFNWIQLKGFEEPEPEVSNAETAFDTATANGAQLPNKSEPDNKTMDATGNARTGIEAGDARDPNAIPDPMRDIAFHILPEDQFNLAKEAQRLKRSPNYRVLFHQAWRQPFVENDENVPAILVRGGDIYNDHYELEGSIKVSLRRWLHVETNFWLTQFATNYGQEIDPWPELPQRPNRLPELAPNPDEGIGSFDSGWWQFRPQNDQYENVLAKPYVIENIMLMKEARKVQRREELHYIDHPQMGVLVYFTQYEPPQPEPEPAPAYNPAVFDGL